MKALGMIEVYSFSTAVAAADAAAKAADVKIIAFDRNRPFAPTAPAPLIMEIKMEGNVAAVNAGIEAAKMYAEKENKYIVSHVIANPDDSTEKMAYLLDINKDKFNKKLPKNTKDMASAPNPKESIGIIEIQGLVAAIEGLDKMLKTADVHLIHTEKRLGGRLVSIVVAGKVSAVSAAVESGVVAAAKLGKVYGKEIIARPHEEVTKYFDFES